MFKKLSILIFTTILSYNLSAQSLSGTLQDAGTNMPVANATVKLGVTDSSETPMLTVSDARGYFNFDNISNGSYYLTVTSIGYATQNKADTKWRYS
jgi:hypothetical protein